MRRNRPSRSSCPACNRLLGALLLLLLCAAAAEAQDLPKGWRLVRQLDARSLLAADSRGVQVVCHSGWSYLRRNKSGHHEFKAAADAAVMIWVPAGAFLRGSKGPMRKRNSKGVVQIMRAGEGYRDEWPQRKVQLDGYYIQKHEVSWRQWARFAAAQARQRKPSRPAWARDDHPVVDVTWDDAVAYCRWVGRRLPSEAQWEKAARGGKGQRYPWGGQAPDERGLANGRFESSVDDKAPKSGSLQERALALFPLVRQPTDGYSHSAPVTAFARGASPYGCLNMAGNVWEWCADAYQVDYYPSKTGTRKDTRYREPLALR